MGGSSKVIMGAMLIMVVSLAMVLGLVLVLLAEHYCSLLLRRRKLQKTSLNTTTSAATATVPAAAAAESQEDQSGAPSLSSFYAQGVLQAPRSFLFPPVSNMVNADLEKQNSQPSSLFFGSQASESIPNYPHVRYLFSSPSSPTSFKPLGEVPGPHYCSTSAFNDTLSSGSYEEQFIYICNPIYDNEASRTGRVDTPYETPESSPSRLDTADSSGEDDGVDQSSPLTPPLTPMKKLPAEACSVSLRDARSLGTSGSDSNSNNDGISLSSSASPCTSPSW